MTETYDDIIYDLKQRDFGSYCSYNEVYHCMDPTSSSSLFTDALLHLAKRVYDAVAGEPGEWFIYGKDNQPIQLLDRMYFGSEQSPSTVTGFCYSPIDDTNYELVVVRDPFFDGLPPELISCYRPDPRTGELYDLVQKIIDTDDDVPIDENLKVAMAKAFIKMNHFMNQSKENLNK